MNKWNLVIDINLCTNCQNCVIATQDEYLNNEFKGYSKPGAPGVKILDTERRIRGNGSMVDVQCVPKMCNHCDDAPCVAESDGAIYKRPDGIVMIDPDKASGQRELVDACPYGMIVWNEQENVPQSWNFDAHLLDGNWSEPRAVQSCPTNALKAFNLSDAAMQTMVDEEKLEVLKPELQTRPRVYYKNLQPYLSQFIGGNVSADINGQIENISDADIELYQNSAFSMRTKTDEFGDFKFDGLEHGSTNYIIKLSHPTLGSREVPVDGDLTESKVLQLNCETKQ